MNGNPTRIADLLGGTRALEVMAAEHAAWTRKVVETRGNATFYERTPAEEHIRQLELLATQIRHSDPREAIEALKRQRALARITEIDLFQSVEWWLRLPKYLHSAGRLHESIDVLEELVVNAPGLIDQALAHLDADAREDSLCVYLEPIHQFLGLVLMDAGKKEHAKEARQMAATCRRRRKKYLLKQRPVALRKKGAK